MGFMNSLKDMFVGTDDLEQEDEYQATYENTPDTTESYSTDNKSREVKIAATTTLQIVLARPAQFTEVKSIGADINKQKIVLLNLETVSTEDRIRILDFISGVAFANGANIKMTAQKTFAIMPKNVSFSGVDLMSELENNGYSF